MRRGDSDRGFGNKSIGEERPMGEVARRIATTHSGWNLDFQPSAPNGGEEPLAANSIGGGSQDVEKM